MNKRSVWIYVRSSDRRPSAMFHQTEFLVEHVKDQGSVLAGISQDMGTGRSMDRMGLKRMMQAVQNGAAKIVLIRDLSHLSCDPAILIQILELIQGQGAIVFVYPVAEITRVSWERKEHGYDRPAKCTRSGSA